MQLTVLSCTVKNIEVNMPDDLPWKKTAQQLVSISDTIEVNNLHTMTYFAYANALINGWEHKRTQYFLDQAFNYIDHNSYGLEYEWDAFGDSTINSDTTSYTITITDHVGFVFLKAYQKGAISEDAIIKLYDALSKIPFADTLDPGVCYAYSDSPYDQIGCVHNVNASVAWFYSELIAKLFALLS